MPSLLADDDGAELIREGDRGRQDLPRRPAVVAGEQGEPEVGARPRQLEPRERVLEDLDRLTERRHLFRAVQRLSVDAQRGAERVRCPERARELEVVGRVRTPASRACATAARSSADLPMPAGPSTMRVPPRPTRAAYTTRRNRRELVGSLEQLGVSVRCGQQG
jgi:hypothetical protein